jgi:hypothetical protein
MAACVPRANPNGPSTAGNSKFPVGIEKNDRKNRTISFSGGTKTPPETDRKMFINL